MKARLPTTARRTTIIAAFFIGAIVLHLVLRFGADASSRVYQIPLLATLVLDGFPPAMINFHPQAQQSIRFGQFLQRGWPRRA